MESHAFARWPTFHRPLVRYRLSNLCIMLGATFITSVIMTSYVLGTHNDESPGLCFLVSYDVVLIPPIFGKLTTPRSLHPRPPLTQLDMPPAPPPIPAR